MGIVASSILGAMAALGVMSGAAYYQQPNGQFKAALENASTSPSFVLITVHDERSGKTRTGCTLAPFLLGAIHQEHGFLYNASGNAAALRVAENAEGHVFTFRRADALDNIRFNDSPGYQRACELIRNGKQAFMADRSGAIGIGLPNLN